MNFRMRAAELLREPLVHFLLAGLAVYALLSGRAPDVGERRIVVDEAVVSRLADRWVQTYRRPPSREEIDGLIRDHVRDEVYYREALRLGLDRDDEVVRRRMRSKLAATATAAAEAAVPTDSELQALLDRDPARYAALPRVTFEQVYLGTDSPEARRTATATLDRLRKGAPSSGLGTPAPLPRCIDGKPLDEVAAEFGDEFSEALRSLPAGQWSGPVPSGVGLHLVRLEQRSIPAAPQLVDVRQRLENDWRSARIKAAEQEALRRMMEGYDVVIEAPR